MSQVIEIIRRFQVKLVCADCGHELNRTVIFENLQALKDAWTGLCFSGPLNSGKCPKGCRSTFSDLNINVRQIVFDPDTNEAHDLKHKRIDELPTTRTEVA